MFLIHNFRELSALKPVSTPLVTAAEVFVEIVKKSVRVMRGTGEHIAST